MKKIVISAMALAVSVMAMATEEAFVKITLSGASGASSVVRLVQDDARTPEYESGYDAEKMMYQANSKSVLLYAIAGSQNLENVMTNQLEGLELGLVTNQVDADYTLKFENVSGNALQLFDKVQNQYIAIVDNGTYAFSVEAAQVGRVAINDRFVIASAPAGPEFCFNYNVLKVNGYEGKALIVKSEGGDEKANVASLPATYSLDLSAESGRFIVTLDGVDYQIDANPAVTVKP